MSSLTAPIPPNLGPACRAGNTDLGTVPWRVSGGAEVDVVLERDDGQVVGIESKARDTVTAADFRGLAELRNLLGDQFTQGIVLHTGRQGAISFGDRLTALPLASLWQAGQTPS